MIQMQKYSSHDLPIQLKWQIFSFIRMEWPKAFPATKEFLTSDQYHPLHFVFVEEDVLISHVAVLWKMLTHEGQTYKTYGLVSVMTFPSYRNQGYGLQLITEAKKYIEQTDADLVFFQTIQEGFYEKAGFTFMDKVTLLKGDPKEPQLSHDRTYMLFLSEKAKNHRSDFETKPVYFGRDVW